MFVRVNPAHLDGVNFARYTVKDVAHRPCPNALHRITPVGGH